MMLRIWIVAAALVSIPGWAAAQQLKQPINPSDPGLPVPELTYQSVFESYKAAKDGKESPDKLWRDTNARLMPKEKDKGSSSPANGGQGPAHSGHGADQGGH